MRLMRRAAAGIGAAALGVGLLAAGTVPAWAGTAQPAGTAQAAGTVQVTAMHETELQAGLRAGHAYPHAAGTAVYEADHHGRTLDVRLSHLNRLAGRHLVVYVHGVRVGMMTVSRAGYAHLELHRGVLTCRAGQSVQVRIGGSVVLSGTFRVHHDH